MSVSMGATKKDKKRKKSQNSPDNKVQQPSSKTNKMASQGPPPQPPVHTPTPAQASATPFPNVPSSSYCIPPQYYTFGMNPASPTGPQINNDFLQIIIQRLDNMDSKLGQLTSIKLSVDKINERLNSMDEKIRELDHSQSFISDQYDTISSTANANRDSLGQIQNEMKSLKADNSKLKLANDSLTENVIDLKCRSMRDNLMFFGIPEHQRPAANATPANADGPDVPVSDPDTIQPSLPEHEDCVVKVYEFCEHVLKIPDPRSNIHVDRAHRIGRYQSGKIRPIVVKFKDTNSKLTIKGSLKRTNLRDTDYHVSDQFPQEIKDRRRDLIPVMLQARQDGQKAVLVRDKLYINNVLYTPRSYTNQ